MINAIRLLALTTMLAGPAAAQSAAAASDPISGTWTGDIGLDDVNRSPLTLQLRYDGTTITGTITGPGPAELKSATFDSKTGTFKLAVDVQDDTQPRRFVFEGIAVKGMVTGRVTDNKQTGTFRFTRGAALCTPQPGSNKAPPTR